MVITETVSGGSGEYDSSSGSVGVHMGAAPEDEDDLMADMAGLAAAAQDPRSHSARRSSPGAAGLLADTPSHDYDNMLSDADAAFMLVNPAVAARYARQAAAAASQRVAAGLAAGRAAAAAAGEAEAEVADKLEQLLGDLAATATAAAASQEDAASAAAVSDDGGFDEASSSDDVLLASPYQVPQSADQRRAAALAAAMEQQQEQRMAERVGGASLPRNGAVTTTSGSSSSKKLSIDLAIDADNPGGCLCERLCGCVCGWARDG